MIKTPLVALAFGAAATVAFAQEAPQPAPSSASEMRAPRIAVIDLARIFSESLLGKSYAGQIESLENEIKSEGTKKQAELQKMEAAIKALQEDLEKQQAVMSPEAVDRKRQEIVKKTREHDAFVEDGQQELRRMRERAQAQAESLNGEFQQKIRPHIDAVAKEKGIDIILSGQVAIAVSKDFDISRDVIVKADDAERAAKAKAAAGKAPASPPAKPSPSPSPSPQP